MKYRKINAFLDLFKSLLTKFAVKCVKILIMYMQYTDYMFGGKFHTTITKPCLTQNSTYVLLECLFDYFSKRLKVLLLQRNS